MSWKYVIVRVGNAEVPIIFPERCVHSLMAAALEAVFVEEAKLVMPPNLGPSAIIGLRRQIKPVSAGRCELVVTSTSGDSETLKLGSRPDDKDRINQFPYTGGIIE